MDSPRVRRLRSDLKGLTLLKSESSIFDFQAIGSPPEQYILTFKGRGVFRPENTHDVRVIEQHEISLRLGAGYPRQLPTLTWKTPVFHPNIASSGVVCLGAYGQHWAPSVTLDELCHMLWDMIRYANFDVESPYNREAAQWARQVESHRFPLDARPLRDITAGHATDRPANILPHKIDRPSATPPAPMMQRESNSYVPSSLEIEFLSDDVVEAEVVEATPVRAREEEGILFIS